MLNDFCFCTVATANVIPELKLLIKSIRLFVGDVPILVNGDDVVARALDDDKQLGRKVGIEFGAFGFDLKKVGSLKTHIIRSALKEFKSVLYVDSDVFFLGDWKPDLGKAEVCMSPHLTRNEGAVGLYNSGYIGVKGNVESFPDWWDQQPKECPGFYGDQQCLDHWPDAKRGLFSEQHNVGWWRFWDAKKWMPNNDREASPEVFRLRTEGGTIFYNDSPLISVHTHIRHLPGYSPNNVPLGITFNRRILAAMHNATDPRLKEMLAAMGSDLHA